MDAVVEVVTPLLRDPDARVLDLLTRRPSERDEGLFRYFRETFPRFTEADARRAVDMAEDFRPSTLRGLLQELQTLRLAVAQYRREALDAVLMLRAAQQAWNYGAVEVR